ncbi:hypothetical protein RJ639_013988 [Escallonia herrerae]|uniref:FAF domain-containing protein n=1 Tax=Escallonia herrerae TaxID=1293975 RepID=A0AA89APZ7_9ASTE|nr:hypothetical protein RJ639_013988 [Escallonia herrerae]
MAGAGVDTSIPLEISGAKRLWFPEHRGLCAGTYSGLTYGLKEARVVHDWKNSAVAGAVTGAALALTSGESSHEQIVQCAITGAAISTAANLLAGICVVATGKGKGKGRSSVGDSFVFGIAVVPSPSRSCCYPSRKRVGPLGQKQKSLEKGKKEYSPAILWLACTENLPSAHMPWVFRRHYTADGRLVITEEKVERHKYFRAHRSDGRLTL